MSVKKQLEECERLFHEDNYQEAIAVSSEILNEDFNNRSALKYMARSLYLLDRCDEALELLNNALILYPNDPHYLYIKSEVFMHLGQYDNAIRCFCKIFEMDESKLDGGDFMKMDYRASLSLRTDELIEKEKYVRAWKCYNRLLDAESAGLKRSERIERFIKYVKGHTTHGKRRKYFVKISSDKAKEKLLGFLNENGFKGNNKTGLMFEIDVIDRNFSSVSVDKVGSDDIISESKFYDKVNYYPQNMIEYKRISGEYCELLYEGYTLHNAPYGFGTAYFKDGTVYREGIFDMKGIVQGREYYPSGNLRFEGQWLLTGGYGPNAPYEGNAYSENGDLIYSGKFEIKRGGVGWPMIQKPKGFSAEQKKRPKIPYL